MDDAGVADSEVLYRRIARDGDEAMIVVDEATGGRIIRSGAFVVDEDGCSVYRDSVMRESSLGLADLVSAPQNVIISVTVAQVRRAALGVRGDPWPDGSDGPPRDVAHALIINPDDLGKKRLHRARQALASDAVVCLTP